MQNKINQFKQLSQEFADRKRYILLFNPDCENSLYAIFYRNEIAVENKCADFEFILKGNEYRMHTLEKPFYVETIDKFKKLIEEL